MLSRKSIYIFVVIILVVSAGTILSVLIANNSNKDLAITLGLIASLFALTLLGFVAKGQREMNRVEKLKTDTSEVGRAGASLARPTTGAVKISRPGDLMMGRTFQIHIDGSKRADVADGDSVEIPLESGPHVVRAKIDFWSSKSVEIDVAAGSIVELSVRPRSDGIYAAFTCMPSNYLLLTVSAATPSRDES